MGMGVLV